MTNLLSEPATTMPTSWVNLIGNGDEDCFDGFLSLIELFAGQKMIPVPAHVLQLVGLVVSPSACLPEEARPIHPDPVIFSAWKISTRAWGLLGSFLRISGPNTLLRCLPGRDSTAGTKNVYPANLDIVSKEVILLEHEGHPIVKRLAEAPDIWDVLSNVGPPTSSSNPNNACTKRTITPGGWDLLDLLVVAWEMDAGRQSALSQDGDSDVKIDMGSEGRYYSPHLIRQFSPASAGGYRMETRVLDIIFEPFAPHSALDSYHWGNAISTRARAQKLAMRLLQLLEELDKHQLLGSGRLIDEVVNKMRILDASNLQIFIQVLPFNHILRIRLLSRFLETITRSSVPSSGGLRRTHSQTLLQLENGGSQSTAPKPDFPSLSSIVGNLLSRALLEMPTAKRSRRKSDNSLAEHARILYTAESRYLTTLNGLLTNLLRVYKEKPDQDSDWKTVVREGRLRAAVQATWASVDEVYGVCDGVEDEVQLRALEHRKLDRMVKAFESEANLST